jgi:endonuclease YncB( thermonuclease family)
MYSFIPGSHALRFDAYMKDFFEKNKVPLSIIVAGFLIAGAIWLSNRPIPLRPQVQNDRPFTPQQPPKMVEPPQQPAIRIDYTEAPNHVGEYACVTGKIDHVNRPKETTFLNFCPDYKTCPFGAVIFDSAAHKFPNPQQYQGQTVEITGLIESYQGRAEIILKNPGQIKILPVQPSSIKQVPALYRVVDVIDGDTIRVDIAGKIETVRLIGIDTPEIAHAGNPQADYFGPEAAQYAKHLLENQLVYLIPDPMGSNTDKYDRLLRYVFLEDGALVNAKLIAEGYAYNYMYEPFQLIKQFDYLEKQAKENRLGLWGGKQTE